MTMHADLADISLTIRTYLSDETGAERVHFHATALTVALAPLLTAREQAARAEAWEQGMAAGSAMASHPEVHRLTPINPYRDEDGRP